MAKCKTRSSICSIRLAQRQRLADARQDAQSKNIGPNHVVVGSFDIYLGVVPVARLRTYPNGTVERTMHGGIPIGPDYYHVNITLANRESHAPVGGATIELRVERPGVSSESKALEPMMGVGSYGNYVRMKSGAT